MPHKKTENKNCFPLHVECSSRVSVLQIRFLSTFLTSPLACSLLAIVSLIFLSTLCMHQPPSGPWALALAVLSTSVLFPGSLNADIFSHPGSPFRGVFWGHQIGMILQRLSLLQEY